MNVRDLMWPWEKHAGVGNAAREFTDRLALYDEARVLAIADMYSAKNEAQIICGIAQRRARRTAGSLPLHPGKRGHRQR